MIYSKRLITLLRGGASLFDKINSDDLIIAFYPCIYFCEKSQVAVFLSYINYRALNTEEKIKKILDRVKIREDFYSRLIKFCAICLRKNIRMIFENPYTQPHYLKSNFLKNPDVIDNNRMLRGDYYKKPTAYWFWNCEPTNGFSHQEDKEQKRIMDAKAGVKAGVCSEERSLISSDYARNWICDFVIGKDQHLEPTLF